MTEHELTPSQATEQLVTLCSRARGKYSSPEMVTVEAARQLLAAGANLNVEFHNGKTLLHIAAQNGYEGLCRLLIEKGLDIEARSVDDEAPLHNAASNGHAGTCELLIAKGAMVDCRDIDACTPLYWAACCDFKDACERLLANGADVNAKTNAGLIPLDVAVDCSSADIVHMLLLAGSNVEKHMGENEWFKRYITAMEAANEQYFKTSAPVHAPVRDRCFSTDGALRPEVLDTCITDQFHALIALPLIRAGDDASVELCGKIFGALPEHMRERNNQTAALLTKRGELERNDFLMDGKPGLRAAQETVRRQASATLRLGPGK